MRSPEDRRVHKQRKWLCAVLPLVLAIGACAEDPVTVKYAPGLDRSRRHISVFGVQRDGLMSRSGWAVLGPYATTPFSEEQCDVAYSDEMFSVAPELASTIDAYLRENGVTAELLEQIAPAAKGDLIMVFTVAGHPLASLEDRGGAEYQRSLPPSRGTGSHRGHGRSHANSGSAGDSASGDALELTASFFSVREHRSVATATLRYSGSNTDSALAHFTTRLEHDFPGSTCSGWDWSVHVDSAKLGKPAEE